MIVIGVAITPIVLQKAYAAEELASGTCGANDNNATWVLYDDGTLYINGSGKIKDFNMSNAPWSDYRNTISSVIISSGITSIGDHAFYRCNVTSAFIPNSVTRIGDDAFAYCKLTNISIPDSVTSIGKYAFFENSNLTSLDIPDSVVEGVFDDGADSFRSCPLTDINIGENNPRYKSIDGVVFDKSGKTIICYPPGRKGDYIIPDHVIAIGESTFDNCDELTGVTIPYGVTSIGEQAFYYCDKLSSINIPDSVTNIGKRAFYNCYKLSSINIPDSVTSIGNYAFVHIYNLESITIPDSVVDFEIEPGSFEGCRKLREINIGERNAQYKSVNGVVFNKNGTILVCCPPGKSGSYKIPEGVTTIQRSAFNDCSNLKVTLPDSMTSIGEYAFADCGDISVTIPNSVTSIGDHAFEHSELLSITIPNSVTSIGEFAFSSCRSLTSLIILDGKMSIGDYAFRGCTQLKNIIIPNSVNSIGTNAFEDIASDYSVHTVPGSYVSRQFPSSHVKYFKNENIDDNTESYLGFKSDRIVMTPFEPVSLSGFLNTNISLNSCRITVSNEDLFIYDDGKIVALGEGTGTLRISNSDGTLNASIKLKSSSNLVDSEGIVLKQSELSLRKGNSVLLGFDIMPEDAKDSTVSWSSSDPSVVSVKDGYVKAIKKGVATITVSLNNNTAIYDSCLVTVLDKPNIFTFEQFVPYTIQTGESQLIQYYLCTDDGVTPSEVSFASNNPDVISIDQQGIMTAHDNGMAKITISSEGASKTVNVTAHTPLQKISLNHSTLHTTKGETIQLQAILTPENTSENNVRWSSSDSRVATVDENGLVTCIAKGYASIRAKVGDHWAWCHVYCDYIPITGFSLEQSSIQGLCGDTIQLKCVYEPENTTEKAVSWSSDKMSVARVDSTGLVTFTGKGIATITAKASSGDIVTCYAYCTGHNWNEEYTIDKPATCTEDGIKSKHCAYCKEVTDVTVIPAGHNWNKEYTIDKAATCVEDGSKSKHCSVCNAVNEDTVEVIPKGGHSFSDKFIVDQNPSCTKDGLKSKHCQICGETTDVTTIQAIGHSFGEWVEITPNTCESNGLRQRTCEVCGTVESENLDSKGHDWERGFSVDHAATCTQDGSQSRHCKNCDAVIDSQVIPTLGHDWNSMPTVEKVATCKENGVKSIHCKRCNAVKKDSEKVIPKTGHKFSAWKTTKVATEIISGQKTHTCSVCGHTEKQTISILKPTLPAVIIITPKATKRSATIKWKKISKGNQKKIASIQIQYSSNKAFRNGVKTVTAKKTTSSKKIKKLTSNQTYYVRIRAFKKSGGAVHVSKWSAVKKVKAK